ncbi:MAG: 3'-5' exonuclease, partial [Planctomycetota bacterium]
DDDQSIYGWRGADVAKILSFESHYPGAKVVRLETNYRSTEPILAVANRLIANNPTRHAKTLRSALGAGEPPRAVCMRDEEAEAEEVVREIREHIKKGAHYDEFAILFRTATLARAFEAELRAREVPYVLVGGMSFFDRKEVRDVLAYLRLVANPLDETSLLRILNCPPRGVGKSSIERVLAFATAQGIPAAEAFARAREIEGLPPRAAASVTGLLQRLTALGAKFQSGKRLVELMERLLVEVAYRDEVTRVYPDAAEAEQRWEAVQEILSYAENHVRRKRRPSLRTFLNELTLAADDRPDAQDAERRLSVTLMTLHASKGLEFPHVYLVGLEEGLLPHARSAAEDSIEEERRLAYVGVTRAELHLTLSWCQERARAGHRLACHPSRFLLEMQAKTPPAGWLPTGGAASEKGRRGGRKGRRRARAAKW